MVAESCSLDGFCEKVNFSSYRVMRSLAYATVDFTV